MNIRKIRQIDPHSGCSDSTGLKKELSLHLKHFALQEQKNKNIRRLSHGEEPNSDQNRYKSINQIESRYKSDIEKLENLSLQVQESQIQETEKQIFAKVYKLKMNKFKPYIEGSESRLKKTVSESQVVKKVQQKKENKKLEDLKDSLKILTQRGSIGKKSHDTGVLPQQVEHSPNKNGKFRDNQSFRLHSQKTIDSRFKESTCNINQANIVKPPSEYTQKISKRHLSSQLGRIGDLELLKIHLRPNVIRKQEPQLNEKSMQTLKRHRRGSSMDQAINPSNKSISGQNQVYEKLRNQLSQHLNVKNMPHPTRENNTQCKDSNFYNEFFDTSQLTFEFERSVINQRNKKKSETNFIFLHSEVHSKSNFMHSRTRSIDELNTCSLNKTNSRWDTQKHLSRDFVQGIAENSAVQDTMNETIKEAA